MSLTTFTKQAAGPAIETSLAQLADAEISQNSPGLADNKVGFQLIESDDSGSRAVGVMVYKLGSQWIYIPVFYLNGRLRGLDLMFIPGMSQMLPNKDSWITWVKSKQPHSIGEPAPEGYRPTGGPGSARVAQNTAPYAGQVDKLASFDGRNVGMVLEDMLNESRADWRPGTFDLLEWVPRLGKTAAERLPFLLNDEPDLANAVLRYYDPSDLMGAVAATVLESIQKTAAEPESFLSFRDMGSSDLTAQERSQLLKKASVGVVARDDREDHTDVYMSETPAGSGSLSTPVAQGEHEVLMGDGSYHKFLVLFPANTQRVSNPDEGSGSFKLVPEDKAVAIPGNTHVQAAKPESLLKTVAGSWGKPISSLRDEKDGQIFVLFDKDLKAYEVYVEKSRDVYGSRYKARSPGMEGAKGKRIAQLELTGKPGSMMCVGDTLYIPSGARYVVSVGESDRRAEAYRLGNANTPLNALRSKLGLKRVRFNSDGSRIEISSDELGCSGSLEKGAALKLLMANYGMSLGDASSVMSEALDGRSRSCLVKYAAEYPSTGAAAAPESQSITETKDVTGATPASGVQDVVKASNAGLKDVMDVGVLKLLAKTHSPLMLVDECIPDMLRALDKVGRLLFLFYWHNEEFKSRYGSEEMRELEDGLRNVFQMLGDMSLFLMRKTVSSNPASDRLGFDPGEEFKV